MLSIPRQMMLVALAGWVNESQLAVIASCSESQPIANSGICTQSMKEPLL